MGMSVNVGKALSSNISAIKMCFKMARVWSRLAFSMVKVFIARCSANVINKEISLHYTYYFIIIVYLLRRSAVAFILYLQSQRYLFDTNYDQEFI